jgi:hypothetical protein
MKHLIALMVALLVLVVFFGGFMIGRVTAPQPEGMVPSPLPEGTMCTQDAMQCPDGSYVGRTGPNCEFLCPDITASTSHLIVTSPIPGAKIKSPFTVTGQAPGPWFFEGSFPVTLVNWDGLVIANGIATAEGEWMTTDLVPFQAMFEFEPPYKAGDPDYMKRGSIILKKDNPSGLPENDASKEIPVSFAP